MIKLFLLGTQLYATKAVLSCHYCDHVDHVMTFHICQLSISVKIRIFILICLTFNYNTGTVLQTGPPRGGGKGPKCIGGQ